MKNPWRLLYLPLALSLQLMAQRDLKTEEVISIHKKRALVIGNAAYPLAPLKNPSNDAADIATVLRKIGFEVIAANDLTLRLMDKALDDFTGSLSSGDLALFYFAGHGVQINQENYLIPTDFTIRSEADVKYDALPASRVRDKLEASGARLRLLILDACRNNPFRAKRDAEGGLAAMKSDAEGTLIAFATGDRNVAADNPGERNGLFTKYLIAAIQQPGLSIEAVFKTVKEDVYRASLKRQNPFTYDNIVGHYYPVSPPAIPGSAVPPIQTKTTPQQPALPSKDIEALRAIALYYTAKFSQPLGLESSSLDAPALRALAEQLQNDRRFEKQNPRDTALIYRLYAASLLFTRASDPLSPSRDALPWVQKAMAIDHTIKDFDELKQSEVFLAKMANKEVPQVDLKEKLMHEMRVGLPEVSVAELSKRAQEAVCATLYLMDPNKRYPQCAGSLPASPKHPVSGPKEDFLYLGSTKVGDYTVSEVMELLRVKLMGLVPLGFDVGGLATFSPMRNGNTKVVYEYRTPQGRLSYEWEVNRTKQLIKAVSELARNLNKTSLTKPSK